MERKTDKNLSKLIDKIHYQENKPGEEEEAKKVVHSCPVCGKKTKQGEDIKLTIFLIAMPTGPQPLPLHICDNCNCVSSLPAGTQINIREDKPLIYAPH